MTNIKPKIGTPEYRLDSMLRLKMQIQEKEKKLEDKKKQWLQLSKEVRSLAQEVSENKVTLFNMI